MSMNSIAKKPPEPGVTRTVLELEVNNHAGVMSHVVGLFSRRAYNVEGILCMPVGDGRSSRIWLTVDEEARLEQMIRQIEKLEDVLGVRRHGTSHEVFERVAEFFRLPGCGDPAQ
jgi:acetolactate synthase-1/3 small subunit